MKPRDIVAIALVVFGFQALIGGFASLIINFFATLKSGIGFSAMLSAVGLAWLIACILFILYARPLAEMLTKRLSDNPEAIVVKKIAPVRAQAIAFSILAIMIGIQGAADITHSLFTILGQKHYPGMVTNYNFGLLISAVFKTAIAVWLFYGSRSLAIYWNRVRGRDIRGQNPPQA